MLSFTKELGNSSCPLTLLLTLSWEFPSLQAVDPSNSAALKSQWPSPPLHQGQELPLLPSGIAQSCSDSNLELRSLLCSDHNLSCSGICCFYSHSDLFFLGLHQQDMEVPRIGFESEPQLPAYITATGMQDLSHVCNLCCSLQQYWSLTHWARPGIEPTPSLKFVKAFAKCFMGWWHSWPVKSNLRLLRFAGTVVYISLVSISCAWKMHLQDTRLRLEMLASDHVQRLFFIRSGNLDRKRHRTHWLETGWHLSYVFLSLFGLKT